MTTPLFSIGGIASGMDTQAMLEALIKIERQPIVRLQQRQAQLGKVDDAWGKVTTRLSAVRSALDRLRRPEGLAGQVRAASGNEQAVTAVAAPGAAPGSLSLTVERLAAAHRVAATGTFDRADALVGAGQFTLTLGDGTTETFDTAADTTLSGLARQISERGAGVGAQVVKTAEGAHRLVLSASRSGAGGGFEIGGDLDGLSAGEVLQEGVDAHVKLGTLDVYRPSNTVTDLVEGVTLQLTGTTSQPVTVTVERDVEGAAAAVEELVTALNATLEQAAALSAYDAGSGAAGMLQGDATLRGLTTALRDAVSSVVGGLEQGFNHGSAVGLGLSRDGRITLDGDRLRRALAEDFDRTVALFARSGATTDARVSYASATERTAAGTYDVAITRAAGVATVTGSGYLPPAGPQALTLETAAGEVVSVELDSGDTTAAAAVAKINAALAAAGVTSVEAAADGDAVTLSATRFGAAHGFDLTGGAVLGIADASYRGQDVSGTIGGEAATGQGRSLVATAGPASGLALSVAASQAAVDAAGGSLALGSATVTQGIGGALDTVLRRYEGSGGRIAGARQSISAQIRRFDTSIADFELRVAGRERTLRRQFTALENAIGQLQSQSAWMQSQLASLSAPPA